MAAKRLKTKVSYGACVACGQRAESFCSGCRVTPYCSAACQRRDWLERHKNTCHNLKRQSVGVASRLEVEPEVPAAAAAVAPLRRPRSPGAGARAPADDRLPPRKFGPPGSATAPTPAAKSHGAYHRANQGSDSDRGQSDNRGKFNRSTDDDSRPNGRPNGRNRDNNACGRNSEDKPDRPRNHDGNRRYGQQAGRPKEDEDWGPKPSEKPAEPQPSRSILKSASPQVAPTADVASPVRPLASVADVAPVPARKPTAAVQSKPKPALVPKNCVIDTLSLKETCILTAESPAEGSGLVCVTLHADHSDNYERLLDPLSQACEASEACEPGPGDTFAYLDPTDGGWYRARLLAPARAALLDAARVATLASGDKCRALHADYAVIPEFCCRLESDQVQLKDQVQCTLVSKSGSDITVSLSNLETGAALGTGTVRRWLPQVERPQEAASSAQPEAPRPDAPTSSGPSANSATAKPSEKPAEPQPSRSILKSASPQVAPTADVASPARPLASVADVAPVPARKPTAAVQSKPKPALVPKNCVIDTLSLKETCILTAESPAEGSGLVCVTLHADHSDNYERLLDPLSQACEASEACEPGPGDTFAYLDPTDGGWYRARLLAPARAALLDAARVATLASGDKCRALHADYAVIPEFCCRLETDQVQLKDQVQCTLVSKSGSDITVSLSNLETGAALGTGTVRRWLPQVEWPQEAASSAQPEAPRPDAPTSSGPSANSATVAAAASSPPVVPRPAVAAGSRVVLLGAAATASATAAATAGAGARAVLRPAARAQAAEFNDLECEVAHYGADEATPRLTELPAAGQMVVARFTDDHHYRALVQRVSSKLRRVLLEYVEYGNPAIVEDLSSLCPCPPQFELSARPTLASVVTLQMKQKTFSPAAEAYLNQLKEDEVELTLTIPSGEKSAVSTTPVRLVVAKSGDDVTRTLDTLSTPEWQLLMERGGDVLETEKLFFQHITYVDLPASGGELDILDCSMLRHGLLAGHARAAPHAARALALAAQLDEYCNSALARDPYTPNPEELCIAMCPTRKQWLRGAMLEQVGGPGGATANILFYDYGYLAFVPVASLRKMMPEFVRDLPAAACTLLIKDFPENPTEEQQERARRHLRLASGVGSLKVTRLTKQDVGEFLAEAPDLLQAIA